MNSHIWVLFRTDGEGAEGESGVVLCGTAYSRNSGRAKGAIPLPLDGLAEGEEW